MHKKFRVSRDNRIKRFVFKVYCLFKRDINDAVYSKDAMMDRGVKSYGVLFKA